MGEILNYPRDILRYKYFARESNQHQAKLEIQTYQWLIEKYTSPGDWILDPMSGVGTVHFAATMGRNTIGVEISEQFVDIQYLNLEKLDETLGVTGDTIVAWGDCRRVLPIPNPAFSINNYANIVIFSPPYGDLWKVTKQTQFHIDKHINIGYDEQDANVGQITNYPLYLNAMREIYKLCNRCLPIGSRMILIVKDYVKQGRRVYCSKDNLVVAMDAGFRMEDWHMRYTDPKVFQIKARKDRAEKGNINRELDIDYEDVMVLTKVTDV